MLVVTRKKDEKLVIGENIEVQVLRIGRENVRLGIKAPSDVSIYRYEIYEAIQSREQAAQTAGDSDEGSAAPSVEGSPASEGNAPATPTEKARAQSEKARAQSEG
jgi:carbon storage regulator